MAHLQASALYGMKAPSERRARHGLAALQSRFEQMAAMRASTAAEKAAQGNAMRLAVNAENAGADLVKSLRAGQKEAAARKTAPLKPRRGQPRIFTGSIGATLTPPYDWAWTWTASTGGPFTNSATAENLNGTWNVSDWTSFNNSSSASARGAVGVFFRPPTETGILQVWSNPAINDAWGDWCAFDGAGSDGWLGLYIGEFDADSGGFVQAPVDQQISLWSDSSWWNGVGAQMGSNSGYPLQATLEVDNAHFYEIWVWGGTDVWADGWHTFYGSGAGGELSAAVPSITWELN
jgi:hypothetical protein